MYAYKVHLVIIVVNFVLLLLKMFTVDIHMMILLINLIL